MIRIKDLTDKDIGRKVRYEQKCCDAEIGELTSWNETFIFVRFKGPGGEACRPNDVNWCNNATR